MKLSALEGFSQMRGIDPHKVNGVASIERAPVALTAASTALGSQVNWTVVGPDGVVYFLTNGHLLFSTTIGGTTFSPIAGIPSAGTGNGLAYFKGHIVVVGNQSIDCYKLSNSTWYTLDETLTTSRTGYNPAFVGQDDKLYIGNGQRVARIDVTGTFDANSTGTYDVVQSALLLPEDYSVSCFGELGDRLMVGTLFGTDTTNPSKTADIFPWNRDTASSFSLPIRIGDEGVNSMVTSNNLLYISAGIKGTVYVTNGSSTSLVFSVPLDPKENSASTITRFYVKPDAFDFLGDEILLGITQGSDQNNPTHNPIGVYGHFNGATRFIGNGSYAKDGSDGTKVRITSVYSISPSIFYVCWWSASTYGIDYYGTNNSKITSYGAYLHTPLYFVGTPRLKSTIEYFDVFFKKPLVSGDGIKISFRTSDSGSFTLMKTIDFATYGAISSFTFPYSIPNLTMVQFLIEITASSTTTPELIQVVFQ